MACPRRSEAEVDPFQKHLLRPNRRISHVLVGAGPLEPSLRPHGTQRVLQGLQKIYPAYVLMKESGKNLNKNATPSTLVSSRMASMAIFI